MTSVRSIAALPMHHDRFVLGVLILAAERPDAFDATVLANAADLAALAAGGLECGGARRAATPRPELPR